MIIFDLDGTLANCEHRRHFVEKGHPTNLRGLKFEEKDELLITPRGNFEIINRLDRPDWKPNWPAFYEACDKDTLIESTGRVYEHIVYSALSSKVEIWSGRCESQREKTLDWIIKNLYWSTANREYLNHTLKMRPIGDNTPDDVLKERWLDEGIAEGKTIDFVFDDRPKVVRMWRRRGIFVFNCAQSDGEF